MTVTYTGKQEKFYPAQQDKLESRFKKLGKLLDGKSEKLAHVILTKSRGMHGAEITVNYMDHGIVGTCSDPDQFSAITGAIDKLEKQVLKIRGKRRDSKIKTAKTTWGRATLAKTAAIAIEKEPEPEIAASSVRIFRVNHHSARKPMTLDEAVLEMGSRAGYLVFREPESDHISVLLRRLDGNLDLIET